MNWVWVLHNFFVCVEISGRQKEPQKVLYFGRSPPRHQIVTYLSYILTFFVVKSGEDREEERKTLMKSRALQSYPFLLAPSLSWGPSVTTVIWSSAFYLVNLITAGTGGKLAVFVPFLALALFLLVKAPKRWEAPRRLHWQGKAQGKGKNKERRHILRQIFWNSFWHIFWHSFWQIFWHIFSHSFCHSFRQMFWHSFWHIFWHIFRHSFWHIFQHSFWQIFCRIISCCILFSASILTYLLTFFLAYLLTFFLANLLPYHIFLHSFLCISSGISSDILLTYLLTFFLAYLLTFFLANLLPYHIFLHSFLCISSDIFCHIFWHSSDISSEFFSGISSDILSGTLSGIFSGVLFGVLFGILSGILAARWGPALATPLGKSPVEARRCPLRSGSPGEVRFVPKVGSLTSKLALINLSHDIQEPHRWNSEVLDLNFCFLLLLGLGLALWLAILGLFCLLGLLGICLGIVSGVLPTASECFK